MQKRSDLVFVLSLGVAGLLSPAGRAQPEVGAAGQSLLQQQRLIDERLADERVRVAPVDALVDWQWGGWLEYYLFHFDDGVQSQRVFQRPSLSLWTRVTLDDEAHEIFARLRVNYEHFQPGDEYRRQDDWVGPNLDRGWYRVDVGRALRLTSPDSLVGLDVKVGRQETRFGTGYVLDRPLDAVIAKLRVDDWAVRGLFGKAIASYPNVDRSRSVSDHSARRFWGVELAYEGWDEHVPFAYVLWNDDFVDERPKSRFQDYAYDTRYFGLGSRGTLGPSWTYWAEAVYENGRSFGDGQYIRRDEVDAWAWDLGIEKRWQHPMRPRATLEYMFASGDPDRLLSPTNARGGNRGDREDTSFVGFGYRDTGISAAPALSNVHVWRAGASLTPFVTEPAFEDLEIGTNWFLYHKHHSRAAISDPTAGNFEGFVGWEMDYFINWRFDADLSWTIRWGAFFPGDAYSDRGMRSFLFTGLTWSF